MPTRDTPDRLRLALRFVGPLTVAVGLALLYLAHAGDDDADVTLPYAVVLVGIALTALGALMRRLTPRRRR
jgi:hypothetical protein